jgi:putative ABC transport system permease protein
MLRWLDRLCMRIRMLVGRGEAGARLDSELEFHLEQQVAENIASGMAPAEARDVALRSFGNPALLREQTRATWTWSSLERFLRDLRIGVRTLGRAPAFTTVAILIMALGIGANVALFTVVRGVLLSPLPFKDPGRLLMLYENMAIPGGQAFPYNNVAGGIYDAWNKENSSFSSMALLGPVLDADLSASGGELPETLKMASFSWNLLPTLGVEPALGRGFTASDDSRSANGTVILSWSLWQRRFGGDRGILNHTIDLDAKPYTVIGVMPGWFQFPDSITQLWTPVYQYMPEKMMTPLDMHNFRVVGRLRPGVTPAEATANLTVITRRIHNQHLDDPFVSAAANSRSLLEHMVGNVRRPLYVLLSATACLLLIACLNVANLLVARAAARRKELAIRTALGGGRKRLLREQLMETFLLSAAGGVAGVGLAYGAIVWLVHTRHDLARIGAIGIDAWVALFTFGIILLCALFSGLISALNAGDRRLLLALHESSRASSAGTGRTRLRKILLAAEVGLTVVLLVAASLLLKNYARLRSTNLGCITDNVLTMRIDLPGARYKTPGPALATFFETLLDRVRGLPGVQAAGFVNAVPGQGYFGDMGFTIVEHPALPQGKGIFAIYRFADPGYFGAMGIPMLRGHSFDDNQKVDLANEVVVSESFVRKYFPGEDPIGKHLRQGMTGKRLWTIVGVVGDTRYSIGEPPEAMQYYPLYTGQQNNGALVIRSSRDVEALALPVQRVIQSMDRDLPVSDVLTMDQLIGKTTLDQSFDATLITGFAVLSLLLAAAGLFGVLSYVVAQRSSEIGIRIALGAKREQVVRLMLADGMRPALAGLLLGLGASAALARLITSMLFETRPLDAGVFIMVAASLLAVAALACLVPAWRASRLDPVQALRAE